MQKGPKMQNLHSFWPQFVAINGTQRVPMVDGIVPNFGQSNGAVPPQPFRMPSSEVPNPTSTCFFGNFRTFYIWNRVLFEISAQNANFALQIQFFPFLHRSDCRLPNIFSPSCAPSLPLPSSFPLRWHFH